MINFVGDKVKRIEAEMRRLSIKAIKAVEQAMLEEFDITFKVGVEIEGWAEKPEDDDKILPLDEHSIYRMFNRRIVDRFYRESAAGEVFFQYEFATRPLAPQVAAMAVVKLKKVAVDNAEKYGLVGFTFTPFNRDIEHNIKTAGMHVNVSLWRGEEALFTFQRSDFTFSEMMLSAANENALLLQRDAFFCVAMSDDSLKRLSAENSFSPSVIGTSAAIDKNTLGFRGVMYGGNVARIENKLPGADADPFLAVLTTIASTYVGVRSGGGRRVSRAFEDSLVDLPPEQSKFPMTKEDALKDLMRDDNRFTALLNELSPGLGTALVEKVAEYAEAKYRLALPERKATGVSR